MAPVADFDPQKIEFALGINDATNPSEWSPPATFPRIAVDHNGIGITAAQTVADTSGRITGLAAQTASNRTSLAPQGENIVPLRLGRYEVGIIAQLAERFATPVKDGADSSWAWEIGPGESDVSLSDRRLWGVYDKRDGHPMLVGPIVIQAVNFELNAGEEAIMTYAPLFQGWRYFSPAGSIVGTATHPLELTNGWLTETNRALADHNVTIEVIGFASPTLTLAAYYGAAGAGATTFTLTAGLDAEGRPNLAKVIDSNSVAEAVMGRAGQPLYVMAPTITGHVIADAYTYENPITPAAVVKPVLPSIPVAAVCVALDGTPLVGLQSMNVNIVNTWQLIAGGTWGEFPRGFKRLGVTTVSGTMTRDNTAYTEEGVLRDFSTFAILVEGDTDTLVDPGGAVLKRYGFTLSLPECQIADGGSFMAFAGGSGDDTRETPFTGVASASLSGASWKFDCNTAFDEAAITA